MLNNQDDSFDQDISSGSNDDDKKSEDDKNSPRARSLAFADKEEVKELSKENQELLNQLKEQQNKQYKETIRSLISFSFPSTADNNQNNINLKHYQKYFEH